MKIRKVSIKNINPATYNPRLDLKPGDPAYEKLKKSINTFGCVEPIVWNERTGNLVGGHQRFKVLIEKGCTEIEVSVVDLSQDKEKALNIALNKITGGWDEDKLARLLEDLSVCPDFDVTLTGFDLPEVSKIVDEQTRPTEDAFDFDSAVESIKEHITKSGDIIHLGPHKLMCGDSGNLDDLKKLMGDDRAQLIYSDPPYNVAYNSKSRPIKDRDKKKWEEIESDNLDQPQYEKWLNNIFTNMGHFFDKGASAYIWNGHRQFYFMHQVLTGLDYHVSSVITWAKDSFAISFAPYNWQTEHCLFFWKKNNGPHNWYGDGKQNNLWYANRDCINNLLHPTQKPVSLAVKAIKNSSKRGDIVLDMFLGSGSTIIASETLNRRTFGVEVNPKYCDAIVRRYIAFVGKEKVSDDILRMYCKEVQHAR